MSTKIPKEVRKKKMLYSGAQAAMQLLPPFYRPGSQYVSPLPYETLTFETEFFFFKKGLLSYMPVREKIRFGRMQSKSPAAGLEKEDKHVFHTKIDGLFYAMNFEKKNVSCFERIYFG